MLQFIILSFIVIIEFILCAILRWQQIITIGVQHSTNNGISTEQYYMKQKEGIITETEFYFSAAIVILAFFYNGYHIYRMQQRLSFEYIEALQINEYAETGKINFPNELQQILGIHQEKYDKDGNVMMEPYKYDPNIDEEEYENININNNNNNNNNNYYNNYNVGRSDDYGSPKKIENGSIDDDVIITKNMSIYSDEEDISKLSTLQSKIDQAIMDEQDSDIDSSSIDDDIKSPENDENLDESIIYSLSTTNPAANSPMNVNIKKKNRKRNISNVSGTTDDDSNAFNIHSPLSIINNNNNNDNNNDNIKGHDVNNLSNMSTSNIYQGQEDDNDIYQFSKTEKEEEKEEEDDDDDEYFDDNKFSIISLIATCKYLSERAGDAITEIYETIDDLDHVKYDEKRSFEAIDKHWIDNKKKLTAGKHASARGRGMNKKKKKNKQINVSISSPETEGAASPFKQKLPPFIKNTPLFQLSPQNAALSISNAIITEALQFHFPELKSLKYSGKAIKLNTNIISPNWIEIEKCKKSKLMAENGKNIERELITKLADKYSYFKGLEEDDLILWIAPLDGAEAMIKKDKETQRSITIMIGIADSNTKRPIAGIIHRPFTKETAIGIPTMGIWPYRFRVANVLHSKMKSKRIVINKYNYNDTVKSYLNKTKYDELRLEGGIGNNVLLLMENESDAVLHPDPDNTHKWHICAIEAIILSLGGDFTQLDGKKYEYGDLTTRCKRGFVATLYGQTYHEQFQYKKYFG